MAQNAAVSDGELSELEPDPDRVITQQDFGRELTLLRQRAGLTIRNVSRAAGIPVSTAGDYFSGRHLPPLTQPAMLPRILHACRETDPARGRAWAAALARARRSPGRRTSGRPRPGPLNGTVSSGGSAPARGRERARR